MTFHLPVANGTYQMVLDFVEPDNIAAGQRQFDIIINGQTVAANVDVVALAGGYNSAVSLSFTVTVSGGQGINLALKNDSASYGAIISGIEIRRANAQGVADPVVSLQLSTDGGNTWNPIATGVTLDQYGNAVVNWMPTAAEITAGNTAYIRATASLDGVTTAATGTSAPFLIASNTTTYYVSVTGNDANSGTDAADPMASLPALLRAYNLAPGDVINVGPGTYTLATNIVLTAADDGVTIQGSTQAGNPTIFNRNNTNTGAYVFEFDGATGVTLDDVNATGAQTGITSITTALAEGITVENSNIYGNSGYGIFINSGFNGSGADFKLIGSTVHNNGSYGVYFYGAGDTVESSQIYGNTSWGVDAYSPTSSNPDQILNSLSTITPRGESRPAVTRRSPATRSTVRPTAAATASTSVRASRQRQPGVRQHGRHRGGLHRRSQRQLCLCQHEHGISVYDATVTGNHVYSNPIGIADTGYAEIDNNVVYSNASAAITISGGSSAGDYVRDNTIYQPGGDGVQIAAGTTGILFYDNIVQVNAGNALKVGSGATGFVSDYNLFYTPIAGAQVGVWNGTQETTLAQWQTASGQDAHSKTGNPLFLNPAGADGILGDQGVSTGNGLDDNFGLSGGSPAINAGDQYVATIPTSTAIRATPIPPRRTPASASRSMCPRSSQAARSMRPAARRLNYQTSNGAVSYTLPFAFTFYGVSYSQVYISTGGFLQFGGTTNLYSSAANSVAGLAGEVRIAPFWSPTLTTSGSSSSNLYADTTVSGQVTIRWAAYIQGTGTSDPVNFSVTLFQQRYLPLRLRRVCGRTSSRRQSGVSAGNGL